MFLGGVCTDLSRSSQPLKKRDIASNTAKTTIKTLYVFSSTFFTFFLPWQIVKAIF